MNKIVKLYLKILPFFLLMGIIGSISRSAFGVSYVRETLIVSLVFDLSLLLTRLRFFKSKRALSLMALLLLSYLVSLANGIEIDRRYITDGLLPLVFYSKIYVFRYYWNENLFDEFLKYFVEVCFWGSFILLPITYYFFKINGAHRLAIFPPLELPFSYFIQGNWLFLLGCFVMILLYGKRAQLGGAVMTLLFFILLNKTKAIFKYLIIFVAIVLAFVLMIRTFPDNAAIHRLLYTFESFDDNDGGVKGAKKISAGRDKEIEKVIELMDWPVDYVLGKGVGFTYELEGHDEPVANVHFSPLAFLSKYGLLFTLFIYLYLFNMLRPRLTYSKRQDYITAYGTVLFVFIESFFSYAIFVSLILPIALGYLEFIYYDKEEAVS